MHQLYKSDTKILSNVILYQQSFVLEIGEYSLEDSEINAVHFLAEHEVKHVFEVRIDQHYFGTW